VMVWSTTGATLSRKDIAMPNKSEGTIQLVAFHCVRILPNG